MSSEYQQWQEIKANYLKLIEKSLAKVDHPRRSEILGNVREHLDSKYAELSPEKKNWESFQQIITEMGPPEEYADLLFEESSVPIRKQLYVTERLTIVFLAGLIGIISYLIFKHIHQEPPQQTESTSQKATFEVDEQVLGRWTTIDFVEHIEDFNPAKKAWPGSLFLLSLEFQDNGEVEWRAENRKPWMLDWTKGKVEPLDERPSFYYLRNIDQQTYLFYEWISGDVTERGREPAYYVLKQVKDGETVIPSWFEEDPQAMGYWVSVDFVKNIDDFQPGVQQTIDLFLKTLRFEDNGRLWWTIGESRPIGLDWTKGKIRPFGIWPAAYLIKPFKGDDYLFYEYHTKNDPRAGYYVFKRSEHVEQLQRTDDIPFENDPLVLGQWKSVDLVENIDQFQPDQTSWQEKLFVKSLDFKEQGVVEWCLGEDNMKINHQWTKGKLLDDELDAHYIIQAYENGDYLFIEWNSGDVTIRGQKPRYYVLKKKE